MENYDDYGDLVGTGFENKEPIAPEDEFFHSIYIAGQMRKNHINVLEKIGMLQVRGVEYNKEKVCMIITHTKQVLCKATRTNNKETVHCFSYQAGKPPWFGTSGNQCGNNSTERAGNEFCSACRAQLLVGGILCDESGSPIVNDDKKPIFGFIRGKGMKYKNVSDHLSEMAKLELDPIFEATTPESIHFEKSVVNNKRFVTEITVTTQSSAYGDKLVFEIKKGAPISKNVVIDVLKIAKKTLPNFNEKMDWSKNRSNLTNNQNTTTGNPVTNAETQIPTTNDEENKTNKTQEKETINNNPVSFEDVSF